MNISARFLVTLMLTLPSAALASDKPAHPLEKQESAKRALAESVIELEINTRVLTNQADLFKQVADGQARALARLNAILQALEPAQKKNLS